MTLAFALATVTGPTGETSMKASGESDHASRACRRSAGSYDAKALDISSRNRAG